jgi:hypothetical protein
MGSALKNKLCVRQEKLGVSCMVKVRVEPIPEAEASNKGAMNMASAR